MARKKTNETKRNIFQALFAAITNSNISGFLHGEIYTGKFKNLCVPGMNCYSCPGAKGACPIGALQAVIGSYNFNFSFYVVGFLLLVGGLIGRFVCGFLCPFGFFQDLLFKIPFVKKIGSFRFDKKLRFLKYIILLLFVIILPMFLVDILGQGSPFFCKLICPVGTLEGGLPLVLLNKAMRGAIGFLYVWKNIILILLILLSVVIYRPFCKYICPLGAIYSLFNPISIFKYRVDFNKCINCGKCSKCCNMQVDPTKNANSLECIRCGKCKSVCPTGAISCGFRERCVQEKIEKV